MTTDTTPSVPPVPDAPKSRSGLAIVLVILAFVAVAAVGIVSRAKEEERLKEKTEANAIISVATIVAQHGSESEDVVLPGTVQAWHEAAIYARTSGYLKSWSVDIGSHVKEGDVLAEIDAPDLDAQYHQVQADLATAEANNQLAQLTAKRWVELIKTNSVSQQDVDSKVATAAADQAIVESAKANLDHLEQQETFKKIVAPFDGTITQRNADLGALINGGNSTGQDLFHIAQADKLRVYVQVPENDVAAITPDLSAELHFPQMPQRVVTAKLSRTADALDVATRSLMTELEVDNADGTLLSGGFVDVHFKLPTAKETVVLPVNTLLFRDGMHVAVVADNHVQLRAVTLGRDFGKSVEIVSGIAVGDIVVINPPDSLADKQDVRVIPAATTAK